VLTIDEFLFEQRKNNEGFRIRMVAEISEKEFLSRKKEISSMLFNRNVPGTEMAFVIKIFFDEGKNHALLEGKANVNIERIPEYKKVFGYNTLYLAGRLK
jgi:hypothetical protein